MNSSYFDLTGNVSIVTGGATGIGRAIAEGLGEFGAELVICGRRMEKCELACAEISATTGVDTLPARCDVSKREDVDGLIKTTIERFGRIDILVNNAGIGGSGNTILKTEEGDWDSVINTNLKGVFHTSRAAIPYMIAQGGGKIINLVSLTAFIGVSRMGPYCASKGGLLQLTKVMALEWVEHNIQVNALCPGYIETPLNRDFFRTEPGKKIIERSIPMKRLGRVEELKAIGVFLASKASSYMTGSAIIVDGGYMLL